MLTIYSKNIVLPDKIIEGFIIINHGKIKEITSSWEDDFIDYGDNIVLPGFIDQHTHGWGRGSFLYENNEESLRMMIEDQAKEGVTGFLATTFTDSLENIHQSINAANEVLKNHNKGTKLLGLHIEGPFINKKYKGAQKEEYCLDPDVDVMKGFIEKCEDPHLIKLITIAPELPNAKKLIEFCRQNGIQVSAGHTGATFEEILEAKKWGVSGVTHMYSAMTGLHHRNPGVVGAALFNQDLYCEFAKQTGITVRHEVFNLTYQVKTSDRIIMTTDCLGNGKQKEPYYHARRNVHFIPHGNQLIERFADGTEKIYDLTDYNSIREIELSYIDSIKNMLDHTKMSWLDVSKITSTNSAKYLGLDEYKGSIDVGKDADFTIITKDVNLVATIVEGEIVYDCL